MRSKPIGVAWFTNVAGCIGIVVSESENRPDEITYRAHISQVTGNDQDVDVKIIQEWGAAFPLGPAVQIIKDKGIWFTKNKFNA